MGGKGEDLRQKKKTTVEGGQKSHRSRTGADPVSTSRWERGLDSAETARKETGGKNPPGPIIMRGARETHTLQAASPPKKTEGKGGKEIRKNSIIKACLAGGGSRI